MTKRLLSLLLAVIMILSLLLSTGCANTTDEDSEEENQEDQDAVRTYQAVTIYCIAGDSMTEEGLAAVEEKISNYCVARYKTSIDLRFFKESEYQSALNSLYDKFAVQDEQNRIAAEAKASSSLAERELLKTMSKEEKQAYARQKRIAEKAEKEEAERKQKEEEELVEEGKDKVQTADEVQLDILYLPTMEAYYSAVDQGLLVDLRTYLNNKFKLVSDYVYPTYIAAATVGGCVYGLPTNQGVVTNETYFVVNKELAEKYEVDWDKVRSIRDLEEVFARVKAGEPGVTPIYGDFAPEDVTFYHPTDEIDAGNFIVVNNDQLLGSTFNVTAFSKSWTSSATAQQFHDYAALKGEWRKAGYLSDTNTNFFLSVQELTEEDRKAMEDEGYLTVLYKGAPFTSEAALDHGVYAISSRSKIPDRAMEVLQLIYTDETVHNLLAFGLEDVNYVVNSNNKTVTIIDDSYSMDLSRTGNILLGYVPAELGADFIQTSQQKNLNSRLDAFLGFRYDWSDPAQKEWVELFQVWHDVVGDRFDKLYYGIPNYEEVFQALVTETGDSDVVGKTYSTWRDSNSMNGAYKSQATVLIQLDASLHFIPLSETALATAS